MLSGRVLAMLLAAAVLSSCWQSSVSHHLRHRGAAAAAPAAPVDVRALARQAAASFGPSFEPSLQRGNGSAADPDAIPYSYRKLDKMMKKAILQIILGELHPADMLLLKALNYTPEQVMSIRKHELARIKQHRAKSSSSSSRESSLEAYNRQALLDYELGPPADPPATMTSSPPRDYDEAGDKLADDPDGQQSLRQAIDRAMERHVVFKIRYDDSEFDSSSDERSRTRLLGNHHTKSFLKLSQASPRPDHSTSTHAPADPADPPSSLSPSAPSPAAAAVAAVDVAESSTFTQQLELNGSATPTELGPPSSNSSKWVSEYEGLEWLGGDVYRVIPDAADPLVGYHDDDDDDDVVNYDNGDYVPRTPYEGIDPLANDTTQYQNDARPQSSAAESSIETNANLTDNSNLTSYQRLAMAQRRDENISTNFNSQGQKAMEEIKLRVLAMTGRFNNTSGVNQVQKEKLTTFSPTCVLPRNTDADAWSDGLSMNMHFQLNVSSAEHVVAAKLRLFKLAQPQLRSNDEHGAEEDEEEEKKIRVSVYFYTKSLKKHRVKKRLTDSVVVSLSAEQGTHLALDVRQALRFWRGQQRGQQPGQQPGHHAANANHGLVVLVEDQDGRPLQPALYIQQPSCGQPPSSPAPAPAPDHNKTSTFLQFSSEPALVTFAS